ncbi:hypothetical protein XELAEV_18040816mg [Xenopus laevis]|uniref:RING-type domain-containing protein n=1 Tax=Xenopus laevis TaxID=8355 RepID=A0A974CA67_XENLA|nr:hypothetical protein XELAEV_18040816mg [Xenopus laevis]
MAAAQVIEELSCSVCREIYTEPVTLPCGHNFCLRCIERTWEGEKRNFGDNPSCPECRRRYGKRPALNKNMTVCNIAERFHVTDPHHGDIWIPCTYCDPPVAAAESCWYCQVSVCSYHVRLHSKSIVHTLTLPTASFWHSKCSAHSELLRYVCTEDGACVCVSCCLAGEHRGHRVELLNEENMEKYIQVSLHLKGEIKITRKRQYCRLTAQTSVFIANTNLTALQGNNHTYEQQGQPLPYFPVMQNSISFVYDDP